jgi:hypothetical protein
MQASVWVRALKSLGIQPPQLHQVFCVAVRLLEIVRRRACRRHAVAVGELQAGVIRTAKLTAGDWLPSPPPG